MNKFTTFHFMKLHFCIACSYVYIQDFIYTFQTRRKEHKRHINSNYYVYKKNAEEEEEQEQQLILNITPNTKSN